MNWDISEHSMCWNNFIVFELIFFYHYESYYVTVRIRGLSLTFLAQNVNLQNRIHCPFVKRLWARYLSRYSNWLRAGRSGDWIPVGVRFSAPVQTGPVAHPASCTMGTGSFPGVKSGLGVTLTPHPLIVMWSWEGRAISLLPLWAIQSLSACTRVHITFTLWKDYDSTLEHVITISVHILYGLFTAVFYIVERVSF